MSWPSSICGVSHPGHSLFRLRGAERALILELSPERLSTGVRADLGIAARDNLRHGLVGLTRTE
eukprot:5058351-Prorocentrum_lima.AAC.1